MQKKWLDFLSQAGAIIESNAVLRFSSLEEEAQNCLDKTLICDLSHLDLLSVQGDEAEIFLQGQLSCDLSKVTAESLQLGSYCTPKGRMVNSFRALNIDNIYYLLMEPDLFEPSQSALSKYIIFSKAEIKNARNDFITLGLAGPEAEQLLAQVCPVPTQINSVTQQGQIICARIAGAGPASETKPHSRFILFCQGDAAYTLWQQFAERAIPVGQNAWHLLDILAGYGQVEKTSVEQFLPHNLNYQSIDAVSFTKGCFTGQEVVARMHYRGQLKSRLFLAETELVELPKPGASLFVKDEGGFKHHAELVNIAISGKDGQRYRCQMLALLPVSNPEKTPLFLTNTGDEEQALPIKILDLPYEIPGRH